MATTTGAPWNIAYPTSGDNVAPLESVFAAQATSVHNALNGSGSLRGLYAAIPAFGLEGRTYYATDTDITWFDTGAAWIAMNGTYTPTFTGLTIGNGSATGSWVRVGNMIMSRGHVTFGSTTSISGTVSVTAPVSAASVYGTAGTNYDVGTATFLDYGTFVYYGRVTAEASTSNFKIYRDAISGSNVGFGQLASTAPFTWAVNDIISWTVMYQAA